MLSFCGIDKCTLDVNGRLKLGTRFLNDFTARCGGEIVMHCLPEGAVALYPEETFAEMRRNELATVERAASSMVARRSMRRFGALSSPDRITQQGRITLPEAFREFAALTPGGEVYVVGVEIGVELWSRERWEAEISAVNADALTKGEREVASDLMTAPTDSKKEENHAKNG